MDLVTFVVFSGLVAAMSSMLCLEYRIAAIKCRAPDIKVSNIVGILLYTFANAIALLREYLIADNIDMLSVTIVFIFHLPLIAIVIFKLGSFDHWGQYLSSGAHWSAIPVMHYPVLVLCNVPIYMIIETMTQNQMYNMFTMTALFLFYNLFMIGYVYLFKCRAEEQTILNKLSTPY